VRERAARKGRPCVVILAVSSIISIMPMSKAQQRNRSREQRRTKTNVRRGLLIAITVVVAVGIVAAVALLRGERSGFDTLNGRWLRLDGGYILEIRAVDPSGKIDGIYLNPKPINIAKAEATRDGSKLNVFVELRAPNYPGSTYTLTYDPQQDQLKGVYFQAVQQQSFNVNFVRMK
jgi:hypothetical protein